MKIKGAWLNHHQTIEDKSEVGGPQTAQHKIDIISTNSSGFLIIIIRKNS